jgi:hypothetical protein
MLDQGTDARPTATARVEANSRALACVVAAARAEVNSRALACGGVVMVPGL